MEEKKVRFTNTSNIKRPKSLLKQMGHKSTFLLDDTLIVTSVAKGKNEDKKGKEQSASKSKVAPQSHIELLSTIDGEVLGGRKELLATTVSRQEVTISGKIYNLNTKSPESTTVTMANPTILLQKNSSTTQVARKTDYLGIKSALEKEFFNDFSNSGFNDNVRVQIAYNILDIRKILATTINNIVSMFYNLDRTTGDIADETKKSTNTDIIGMIKTYLKYDEAKNSNDPSIKKTFNKAEELLINTKAYHTYFDRLFTTPTRQAFKAGKLKDTNDKKSNLPCEFSKLSEKDQEEFKNEAITHNYDVLRLLGLGRQLVVHEKYKSDEHNKDNSIESLFNIDKIIRNSNDTMDLLKRLDNIYLESARQIDNSFKKSSATNCFILEELYKRIGKAKTQAELYKNYYRYAILKEDQCLGISFNRIKEAVLEKLKEEQRYKNFEYRNNNKRFYTLCNFVLWHYMVDLRDRNETRAGHQQTDRNEIEDLKSKLRACCDNNGDGSENQKYAIYKEFVNFHWKELRTSINTLYNLCVKHYKEPEENYRIDSKIQIDNQLSSSANNVKTFVKYIYFLSEFLDGKEVNVFFNELVEKFSNIAEIVTTVNDNINNSSKKIPNISFLPQYSLFQEAGTVADQLRNARNIKHATLRARINDKVADKDSKMSPSKQTISDALYMLIDENDAIENYKQLIWDEEESGKWVKKAIGNNKVRNFIINNIIMSKWFMYISKYSDPRNCSKIMHNKEAVVFAMSSIPDAQIEKYYKRVTAKSVQYGNKTAEEMRSIVIDALMNFSLKPVLTGVANNDYSNENRERDIGIIQLYLTVAYIVTKSLVNVNKRFLLAFSCLERDVPLILNGKSFKDANMLVLSEKFIAEDQEIEQKYKLAKKNRITPNMSKEEVRNVFNELNAEYKSKHYAESLTRPRDPDSKKDKSCACLVNNLNEAKKIENVLMDFKNKVDHLNVVKSAPEYMSNIKNIDSFYGIFCFALQNILADKMIKWSVNEKNSKEDVEIINSYGQELKKKLDSRHTFDRDAMWIINMPFAYNFPRYKNLSSEYLFYDKEYEKTKK